MSKKAFIVIGLGFGDEGKGLVTDYLCSKHDNAIVVRFNGGQQAGHTVTTKNGVQHIFSNFGSGTFRNTPTYWSSFCTFSPAYFLEELHILQVQPVFFLDRHCPVTTHYDVLYNRAIETSRGKNRYGSVGVGFGATIDRHYSSEVKLLVEDLFQPIIWKEKLKIIRDYYSWKIDTETTFKFNMFDHDSEDKQLVEYISQIENLIKRGIVNLVDEKDIFSSDRNISTYIFEGAQGVLLDNNYGNNPYITKSNTTSKNALEILLRNFAERNLEIEIFYVTRAYHTRHGSGPFSRQDSSFNLKNNASETNKDNEHQGIFKISYLNTDLLNYALACDGHYSKELKKSIVVTCLDQIDAENLPVYSNGRINYISYRNLLNFFNCKFNTAKFSFHSCSDYLDINS